DQTALDLRWRDREDDLAVELPEVVADDPAGRHDAARVARGEVGADDGPALSLVGSPEDHLTAVVHGLRIERIDRERRCPVTAVLERVRRRIERMDPRRHGSRPLRLRVPSRDFVSIAAGPDDVRVAGSGQRESGLAAAEPVLPVRSLRTEPATFVASRRSAVPTYAIASSDTVIPSGARDLHLR